MRYMLIMQVHPGTPQPGPESFGEIIAAMGAYNESLQKAGVFLSAEGLSDAGDGFRVDFESVPPVVTDGPFAEAREVFTGFWIVEVATVEEAKLWAARCPLGPGVSLEVRRVNELSDFDAFDVAADNEWLAKEAQWRAAND